MLPATSAARSTTTRSTRSTLAIVERVNATGAIFISSTKLHGRVAIRGLAIGNERTTRDDVALAWELLRGAGETR